MQRPFVPGEPLAFELEADALRLGYIDRFQIVPVVVTEPALVIVLLHGHGHDTVIVDADHFAGLDIDHRIQPLDRMSVEKVVVAGTHPGECVTEVASFLARDIEIARRPRVDTDMGHVIDTALLAGCDEIRI